MRVLWISASGTKFVIEADTLEECKETISQLRIRLDEPTPDILHVHAMTEEGKKEAEQIATVEAKDVPEKLAKYLEANLEANLNPETDPSKLN